MNTELYNRVAELSTSIESGKTLFNHLVKALRASFDFDDAVFAKIDSDETHSVFLLNVQNKTSVHTDFEDTTVERFSIRDGLANRILDGELPLVVNIEEELKVHPDIGYLVFMHSVGLRSFICIKIQAGNTPIGLFYLQSRKRDAFTRKDIELFHEMCPLLSMAFSNILFRYRFSMLERDQKFQIQINNDLLSSNDFKAVALVLAELINCRIGMDVMALTCVLSTGELEYEVVKKIGDENFVSASEVFEESIDAKGLLEEKRKYIHNASTKVYTGDGLEKLARSSIAINRKKVLFGIQEFLQFSLPVVNNQKLVLSLGRSTPSRFSLSDINSLETVAYQISLAIEKVLSKARIELLSEKLETHNTYLNEEIKRDHNFTQIIGRSDAIHNVFLKMTQVAPTNSTVLITGETGTGKELIARALHDLSERAEKPFVKVNMAAIPEALIESELFGHEKGSFTGALARKIGKFEIANQGTIFLDEIGEMPVALQAKLLRVLQEQEIERLGGIKTIPLDVRILAATNRNLLEEVEEKRFREDLYYRLNVFPIELPALRERREDIISLVEHFIQKYSKKLGKPVFEVDQMMLQDYLIYDWPGNIRELEHLVEKSMIMADEHLQLASPVLKSAEKLNEISDANMTLDEVQKAYISKILKLTKGKIRGEDGAAEKLGLKPTTLESRMKKLGLKKETSFNYE